MQCKDQGLTDLFMVVWNNGKTMFPSQVMSQYVGQAQDPVFTGRDPLQEMIEEAHAVGLRVHAWMEFGFSYSYKDSNSIGNKKYPTWAGRNAAGNLLQKNLKTLKKVVHHNAIHWKAMSITKSLMRLWFILLKMHMQLLKQ